ncbi:MAG: hypothetical protein ACRDQD_01085 [Nocardioidaceae bacterium]
MIDAEATRRDETVTEATATAGPVTRTTTSYRVHVKLTDEDRYDAQHTDTWSRSPNMAKPFEVRTIATRRSRYDDKLESPVCDETTVTLAGTLRKKDGQPGKVKGSARSTVGELPGPIRDAILAAFARVRADGD